MKKKKKKKKKSSPLKCMETVFYCIRNKIGFTEKRKFFSYESKKNSDSDKPQKIYFGKEQT